MHLAGRLFSVALRRQFYPLSLKTLNLASLVICSILIILGDSNAAKSDVIDDGRSCAGTGNANLFKMDVTRARESAFCAGRSYIRGGSQAEKQSGERFQQ